jgi:hypothetical protein
MATEDSLFYVYPNPSNGSVRLSTGSDSDVTARDINGRIVYSGKPFDMQLDTGVYIIEQDGKTTRVTITR